MACTCQCDHLVLQPEQFGKLAWTQNEFTCGEDPVAFRKSLELEDRSNSICRPGQRIQGRLVVDAKGAEWIEDDATQHYLPVLPPGATDRLFDVAVATVPSQASMGPLPPGVPKNSGMSRECYRGRRTWTATICGFFFCGPLSLCVFLCPIDERYVFVTQDGRKFDLDGVRITA